MSELDYTIVRRPRRHTVAIVVRATGKIEVLAPPRTSAADLARFVHRKQDWLHAKLAELQHRSAPPPPREWISGAELPYFDARLKLQVLAGTTASVRRVANTLLVRCRETSPDDRAAAVKRLLETWYKNRAHDELRRRLDHWAAIVGGVPKTVTVRDYRRRWGSCFRDGRIVLNWRLLLAPLEIADYVVVHELCHLLRHDHSPTYYAILARYLPDWRRRRQWLHDHEATLTW